MAARAKQRSLSYESLHLNGFPTDQVSATSCGKPGTLSFRIFFSHNGPDSDLISPWHDILLFGANGNLTSVCTTPSASWLTHNVAMDEPFNPLRPVKARKDLEDSYQSSSYSRLSSGSSTSQPRPGHLADNAPWNVGLLPQTWINVGRGLDSFRPMEIIDIGADVERQAGDVYSVKPLGACCMEENGTVTWKVIGISSEDSMAAMLADIDDVELWLPGLLLNIETWLKSMAAPKRGHVRSQLCTTVHLLVTRQKLFELHDAWRLHPGRVAMQTSHLMIPVPPALSPNTLHESWRPYLDRFRESEEGDTEETVPNSCPVDLSELLFDRAWMVSGTDSSIGFRERIEEETEEAMELAMREEAESRRGTLKGAESMLSQPGMLVQVAVKKVVGDEADKQRKRPNTLSRAKKGFMKLLNLGSQGEETGGASGSSVEAKMVESNGRALGRRDLRRSRELTEKERKEFAAKQQQQIQQQRQQEEVKKSSEDMALQQIFEGKSRRRDGAKMAALQARLNLLQVSTEDKAEEGKVQSSGKGSGGQLEDSDFSRQMGNLSKSSSEESEVDLGLVAVRVHHVDASKEVEGQLNRTRQKIASKYMLPPSLNKQQAMITPRGGSKLVPICTESDGANESDGIPETVVHRWRPRFEDRSLRRSVTSREPVPSQDRLALKALLHYV